MIVIDKYNWSSIIPFIKYYGGDFILLHNIFMIVTFLVTFVLGIIAKKHHKIKDEIIPLQNLIVGIISSLIYFFITKDFSLAITSVGLFTGGIYDILIM